MHLDYQRPQQGSKLCRRQRSPLATDPGRGQSSVGGDVSRVYPSPGRGDTRLRNYLPAADVGTCCTRQFRRGLREGLQRKCFWPETNCKSLSYNGVGANNYSPLRIWRAKNIAAESPTARRRTVTKRVVETHHGTSLHLRDADASIAAPARPNNKDKKTTIVCLYPNIFVPLRGFY